MNRAALFINQAAAERIACRALHIHERVSVHRHEQRGQTKGWVIIASGMPLTDDEVEALAG